MPTTEHSPLFIAAVATFCATLLAGIVVHLQVERDLRIKHPTIWNELGRPSFLSFSRSTPRHVGRLYNFIFSDRPHSLNDLEFARLCGFYWKFSRYIVAVQILCFVVMALAG